MDVGTLADIGTMFAVLVAVAFGIAQVRQNAAKRRETATAEIVRAALSPEFIRAVDRVLELPDHASIPTVLEGGPEMQAAIRQLDFTYQATGWMVYRKVIELAAIEEIMGGIARLSWRKLDHYFAAQRGVSPNAGEWFEWLVIQLDAHPLAWKNQGAHVALRSWKP